MTDEADYYLDITRDTCPMTFVKAKLLIERMQPGEVCVIRLQGAEPLANVPRSLAELGHRIIALEPDDGEAAQGTYRLRVVKIGPSGQLGPTPGGQRP